MSAGEVVVVSWYRNAAGGNGRWNDCELSHWKDSAILLLRRQSKYARRTAGRESERGVVVSDHDSHRSGTRAMPK
jgi:hypothetical protein